MLPRPSQNNAPNGHRVHVKFTRQLALLPALTDPSNLQRLLLAQPFQQGNESLLDHHVDVVIFPSSEPQVTGIYAAGIIASWTVVQYAKVTGDRAVVDLPRGFCGRGM